LWEATADGAPLSEDDARAVEDHLSRQKTTRGTASEYLIAAYEAAGVPLPEPEQLA
jgi:cytochrome c553